MDLRISTDPAVDASRWLARRLRDAARRRGSASLAVSGGSTAPLLFEALAGLDVPWRDVTIWQVDERAAPDGHNGRNASQLDVLPARVKLMPVTSPDLAAAARRYARTLPDQFDVVHLGLGSDGHTASWPPNHDVVKSARPVEVIDEFNGYARMTLTPLVVNRARARLMFVVGRDKAEMIERWLLRDPDLPVTQLRRAGTSVFLDPDAASRVSQYVRHR